MSGSGGLLRAHGSTPFGAIVIAAALALVAPATAAAQDHTEIEHERAWFVPRFIGALSLDATLGSALGRRPSTTLTTLAGSIGWRHYFDGHGTASVRLYALYGHGGLIEGGLYGSSRRAGGGAAITARALSDDFLLGTLSLFAEGAYLQFDPPDAPAHGFVATRERGSQFTLGLETTFGSLFMLAPYLFGETGASLSITTFNLPSVATFEFWGRWVLRFDWAVRRGGVEE